MSTKIIPRFRDKPKRRAAHNKKSMEQYQKELSDSNSMLVVLEEYVDSRTPIFHNCIKHNYIWKIAPTRALKGQGCKYCKAEKIRNRDVWSHDYYLKQLEKVNLFIVPLERYINARTAIWHWFTNCGHIVKSSPQSILREGKCLRCTEYKRGLSRRLSTEEFISRAKTINPYVEILSQYYLAVSKITCKCKLCGHKWDVIAESILQGYGCPICNLSHGEKKIIHCLKKYNVDYIPQYTFDGLVGIGGGLLSYDFYLQSYNLLLEYQGEQHERPAFGENVFYIQKEHDKRKREYAKQHNINLLEIWYYDYDRIEEILKENLNLESVETVIEA